MTDHPSTLVVVLHGWKLGPKSMDDVDAIVRRVYGSGTVVCRPDLAYARWYSTARASKILVNVLDAVDDCIANRGPFDRVVLVGHSVGATLIRRLFLVANGAPYPSLLEADLAGREPKAWARKVERIVLLAAFNRGWSLTARTSWYYSALFNAIGLIGHLGHLLSGKGREWVPSIFDFRLGAPFMVQTRLHWMAYRRGAVANRTAHGEPIVVQLIGSEDDLIAPIDQIDLSADGLGRPLVSGQGPMFAPDEPRRDYFLVQVPDTDHENAVSLEGTDLIITRRRALFELALTGGRDKIARVSIDPTLLADEIDPVQTEIRDTVFVIHGIRDDGFWTHRIAGAVRLKALKSHRPPWRGWTPTYGYFAMLPFVLPWIRRQKVEWFMDQYVSAYAQYPQSDFHFVGHSNGTYLAARAFKDYPAFHLKHVFFAGSVVRRDYDWHTLFAGGRVTSLQNVCASKDWVVAWLPKSLERWRGFDLGGGGFDGFRDATRGHAAIHELKYVVGTHGGGIIEAHWTQIANFIVDGTPMVSDGSDRYASHPDARVAAIAKPELVLPAGAVLFAGIVPWLLWWLSENAGLGWQALILLVYFWILHFIVTRV